MHDVVGHMVQTAIRRLSRQRDQYLVDEHARSPLGFEELSLAITAANDRWTELLAGVSPRVLAELVGPCEHCLAQYLSHPADPGFDPLQLGNADGAPSIVGSPLWQIGHQAAALFNREPPDPEPEVTDGLWRAPIAGMLPEDGYPHDIISGHSSMVVEDGATDWCAPDGTPIRPIYTLPGTVQYIIDDLDQSDAIYSGYFVRIRHDDGTHTLYAHLNAPPLVAPGQRVEGSTLLGYVGSTGNSHGPHVHTQQYAPDRRGRMKDLTHGQVFR